ncbi:MAG: SWIM zinc finger domain-containing protein, partial [Phycisphaerae bacterium]
MGLLTRQQVLDLAPDAGSAKAGEGLSRAVQWQTLGQDNRAVWGEICGSGKKPYQVRIDLSEPAFKCSCPSRKFPCKHAIGLLLVLTDDARQVVEGDAPEWVADWLQERVTRREKRETKVAASKPDPEAQTKRAVKREQKVAVGVDELALWLTDIVRQGLGSAQAQPTSFWEGTAARMVDAQAPGLARLVRRLSSLVASGEGWQAATLTAMGQLHLLLNAYRRLDALPADLQLDVRSAVGWTFSKDELSLVDAVRDTWLVSGQV